MKCIYCGNEDMEYKGSWGGYDDPPESEYKCEFCGATVHNEVYCSTWESGRIKEEYNYLKEEKIITEIKETVEELNKTLPYQNIKCKFDDEGVEVEINHKEWETPNIEYIPFENIKNINDFKEDYLMTDVRG